MDFIVLKVIVYILGIKISKKKLYYLVVIINLWVILNIIDYYSKIMKGIKVVEFRIWVRFYVKYKGNYEKLNNIRENVRVLRKIRLNDSFKFKD